MRSRGDAASQGYLVATLAGLVGMAGGAAAAGGLVYAAVPGGDGWAELGRVLFALAAAVAGAVAGGSVGIARGLRRRRLPYAGVTALVFVPVVLLPAGAVIVAGRLGMTAVVLGVAGAPAAARWLVLGFAARRARVVPGYGPAGQREVPVAVPPVAGVRRSDGLPQRVVAASVLTGLAAMYLLAELGPRLGGQVGGGAMVWAGAAVPALVVPVLLLRRHLHLGVVVLLAAVLAGLVGLGVPGATAHAPVSSARLEQLAGQVRAPAGQHVVRRVVAAAPPAGFVIRRGRPTPVVIVQFAPAVPAPDLPAALSPGPDGSLPPETWPPARPPRPGGTLQPAPTGSERGQRAAAALRQQLQRRGWQLDEYTTPERRQGSRLVGGSYWLPDGVRALLDGEVRHHRGRAAASVIGWGDGALLVLSSMS